MGVVNVIVKHLVLSRCAVDGHSTNPLYYCCINDEHVYILILCVSDVICFCSFMKEKNVHAYGSPEKGRFKTLLLLLFIYFDGVSQDFTARYVALIPFVSDAVIFPGICDIWSTCDVSLVF